MKKTITVIVANVILIFATGCNPLPDWDSPQANFDILWEEFELLYALFEQKGVDWDDVYSRYSSEISNETTEEQLYLILCRMLGELDDGHVSLKNNFGEIFYSRNLRERYESHFDYGLIKENYLSDRNVLIEGELEFGWADEIRSIGYVRIDNWSAGGGGTSLSRWGAYGDLIVDYFESASGLVIDVRDNTGGNFFNAEAFASRFISMESNYLISRSKRSNDSFTDPTKWFIKPEGERSFSKPLILLTNGLCFSANEVFLMMFDERNETHYTSKVGTVTGGGQASRIQRELPNGWIYTISIQLNTDRNGICYEGSGIRPDVVIDQTNVDAASGIDRQLEEAIQVILALDA